MVAAEVVDGTERKFPPKRIRIVREAAVRATVKPKGAKNHRAGEAEVVDVVETETGIAIETGIRNSAKIAAKRFRRIGLIGPNDLSARVADENNVVTGIAKLKTMTTVIPMAARNGPVVFRHGKMR